MTLRGKQRGGVRSPNILAVVVLMAVAIGGSAVVAYRRPRPLKDAYEHVKYWNRLEKFTSLLQQHNLTGLLRREGITVFAPVASAYSQFVEEADTFGYDLTDPGTMANILRCHIGEGIVSQSEIGIRTSIRTFHPQYKHLYFNSYNYGDSKVYSVSGAWVVDGDILASNGYVHIIDRFLVPIQSKKPIAQFLEAPDLPNFSFGSIKNASVIDPELTNATNSSSYVFTVFSPNDSYITTMPKYGQDRLFSNFSLLKTVFWAHMIEGEIMFIPRLGDLPSKATKAGVVKFHRVNSEVYVSNNKVRAKVIQPNIPVANGVIHVVDDLLFFIYRNIRQKIDVLPSARTISNSISKVGESLQQTFEASVRRMTFFLPTDDAFAKLPTDKQMRMDEDNSILAKMLRDHLLMYAERDIDSLVDGERFTTRDGEVLIIHREHKDVYVEGGGIKAKVTVPDIGCTNGVIHLINSVLFQRDFTIWEAISGNPQLRIRLVYSGVDHIDMALMNEICSNASDVVHSYPMFSYLGQFHWHYDRHSMAAFLETNRELRFVLDSGHNGPMTVFLISDAEYKTLPPDTIQYLQRNATVLEQAVRGSIVDGIITSSQVTEEINFKTHGNITITLFNSNQGLYIIGSRIRANVVISDIWCSNGIVHIVDNILHIPTRNILDEIRNQPTLSTMAGILEQFSSQLQALQNTSYKFTMFVPTNDAFTYMPTYRGKKLTQNPYELQNVVLAHIIPGEARLKEDYREYNKFQSLLGSPIFILKSDGHVSAVSNNVRGAVLEANVRCTNGVIHLVDTLLHFPYWTVAETIEKTDALKPFYRIIESIDGFDAWANTPDVQQTLFVPSEEFLENLSNFHSTYIMSEPGLRRKLYEGHYLQDITLSQLFLDNEFRRTMLYVTESRYNVTFILRDRDSTGGTELTSVDIGYNNLRWTFDAVKDGIGCSNGVIYIINGFLNYPLRDIAVELKLQPQITVGADLLTKLIPKNSSVDLESTDTKFTVFTPSDDSFQFLTLNDIRYINENLTYAERMEITSRHIVIGQQFSEEDILNGQFHLYAQGRNLSIVSTTNGLYLRWRDIEAKIICTNILAINGIIHVVDRFLLSTPYQTTTPLPTTAKTTRTDTSSSHALCVAGSASLTVAMLLCVAIVITVLQRRTTR